MADAAGHLTREQDRRLRARAGRRPEARPQAARSQGRRHLRLSWRHRQDWRKLRTRSLRLTRDGSPAGAIWIRPRAQRITADGAVQLTRKQTRLTRKGKTVTAQLALR